MFNHLTLRVKNFEKSKSFYSHALKPLDYQLKEKDKDNFHYTAAGYENREGHRDFWIKKEENYTSRPSLSCLAFTATSIKMVDNFYKAAIEVGGIDNGAPGYRKEYHAGYYAAFVLDPDGNNIEAVFDGTNPEA